MKINFEGKEVKLNARKDLVVYAVWCDDVVYIGSGKAERVSGNKSKLKNNKHSSKLLQERYNEIGECKVEVLALPKSDEEAREVEQAYINHYNKLENVIVTNKRKASNGATSEIYNKYERLTEEKVAEIKYFLDAIDVTYKELAEKYNCSENAIRKIYYNHRWQNVEPLEF